MTQHNESTISAEKDIQEIKKEIEALVARLGSLKDKSGDVVVEQLDNLAEAIIELKHKGEKKGKEAVKDIASSTREHPLRNLGYAFGLGVLLSLIISK